MTDGELPPGEDISIARNYRDGCVWLSIGDSPRKCISPDDAREMANAIEWQFGPFDNEPEGYQTQQLVDDLKDAANDVENADGDEQ